MKSWCAVCCTQHVSSPTCPGELRATGPERYGRRVQACSAQRIEIFGVLIAEAGDCWRGRVLTFPNMLWSVPGGRGTMKFVGNSAAEAEQAAVDYILAHCEHRKLGVKELTGEVRTGPIEREAAAVQSPRGSREPRHLHDLSIRYGEEQATEPGRTSDLSNGGLCVITEAPLPQGTTLKLILELDAYNIPLAGEVAWCRATDAPGRPAGMGVQLTNPPSMYVRYVRTLVEQQRDIDADESQDA